MNEIKYSWRAEYRKTPEFIQKKESVIKETKNKYQLFIKSESNILKKVVLWFKMQIETKKKLDKLSSNRSLFIKPY